MIHALETLSGQHDARWQSDETHQTVYVADLETALRTTVLVEVVGRRAVLVAERGASRRRSGSKRGIVICREKRNKCYSQSE